jgi:hypothetical protein
VKRRLRHVSIREIHLVLPEHDSVWTVWSDALVDPISGGSEERAKTCVLERRVVIRGDPEQYVRSPDGSWYRWDSAEWVLRPEGGAAVWCAADDCPACACPFIPGSCSAAA